MAQLTSLELFRLNGSVAAITGGAGYLGGFFARGLLEAGAKVALLDLKFPELPSDLAKAQTENRLVSVSADITSKDSLAKALATVKSKFGAAPDILVNNAAIDSPPDASAAENGPFETYPEASLDRILDVNVKGMLFACQVFGAEMARAKKGSIVNISSIYGLLSPVQDIYEYKRQKGEEWYKPVAYSVSKSAVLNLTRYLSTYWAKQGVRVNTLTPAGIFKNQDREFLAGYTSRIPVGRMARPDEMVGPLIFLASDASSYMTGGNLVVDGGWTAW